jgi:carbamoyl-phosphate synthase large subunit
VKERSTLLPVKAPVFPFNKFRASTRCSARMKSTGEVMGVDARFGTAFAGEIAPAALPRDGKVFVSVRDEDKRLITLIDRLHGLGEIVARAARARAAERQHPVQRVFKLHEVAPTC